MHFLTVTQVVLTLLRVRHALSSGLGPAPGQIKNLVTFGDSYTDVVSVGDGGTAWPVYAAGYANVSLYPFAKSGATCSNNLTFRPFPSVFESQLPTYFSEIHNDTIQLNASETIYTLWIGTNDVGVSALLTGGQMPGVTIKDTTACAVKWLQTLYDNGTRNFIFQNMIPLEHVILYSNISYPNKFWDFEMNTTEWSIFMNELTTSGNALSRLMLQVKAMALTDAHIGYFNSHGLFTDMLNHPENYLNGTAPLNVTGCVNSCVFPLNANNSFVPDCVLVNGTDRDSFLWFDELHPSEQADRIVARHIANVITGNTSDTKWFS